MSPLDARHGTRAGRLAGCDCEPCIKAANAYYKQYRQRVHKQGGKAIRRDATRAREHLTKMRQFYSTVALANLTTGSSGWVSRFLMGNYPTISPANERRVLAIRPGMDVGTSWVAAWPAQRRIQALMALGYSMEQQCSRIGYKRQNMAALVAGRKPYITSRVDLAVRAMYDELTMTLPSPADHYYRGGSTKARQTAARNGWAPPLAWDDIDDPNEQPSMTASGEDDEWIDDVVVERILAGDMTLARQATPAERVEVCRRWVAAGGSLTTLARRAGWKPERYLKLKDTA